MNEQLTQLPEYWYCQRNNENAAVLNKWNNEKYPHPNDEAWDIYDTVSMLSHQPYAKTINIDKSKYKEISFRDFQRWILNKQEIYKLW